MFPPLVAVRHDQRTVVSEVHLSHDDHSGSRGVDIGSFLEQVDRHLRARDDHRGRSTHPQGVNRTYYQIIDLKGRLPYSSAHLAICSQGFVLGI